MRHIPTKAVRVAAQMSHFRENDLFSEYISSIRKRAIAGDLQAQLELGVQLQWGDGIEQDLSEAFKWIGASAKAGNPSGLVKLAQAFREGLGTQKDTGEAIHLYCEALRRGSGAAAFHLAQMVRSGEGLAKDKSLHLSFLKLSAARGFYEAAVSLAMIEKRLGHKTLAIKWLRKAAAIDPEGCELMAREYERGTLLPASPREAFRWRMRAAEAGIFESIRGLIKHYSRGIGVQRNTAMAKVLRRAISARSL